MSLPYREMEHVFSRARRRARLAALLLAAVATIALVGPVSVAIQEDAESADPRQVRHRGDLIQVFDDVHIPAGTLRDGSIVCIGGSVVIEGEVSQDVTVILGSLTIDGGEVRQNVFGILSRIELRDAEIRTDLYNIGGSMTHENVSVGGQQFDLGIPGAWFPGFLTFLTWVRISSLLFVFIMLVLLVVVAPDRVRLIGQETPVRYVSAFFVGILVYCGLFLVVLPIAAGTIIGLPVLYLAYLAFKWLGLAGMFHAAGRFIGRGFGREMSPLGAVLLVYALYSSVLLALSPLGLVGLGLISVLRMLFFCFFEVPAVGLVLLTRLGTRTSPGAAAPPGHPGASVAPPPPSPSTASPADTPGATGLPRDPSADRSD